MLRQYLMILRTLWFGGVWIAAYLVRPLLEQRGFFPHHGVEIVHAVMGMGVAVAIVMLFLMIMKGMLLIRQLPTQLIIVMGLLSLSYFAFMPWWRLQMIIVHMVAILALVSIFIAPSSVIRREKRSTRQV